MEGERVPAPRLSGCVMAFMEEQNIGDCLRSMSFCDEILVVDSGSTDRTREIAESLGARVLVNAPFPGWTAQRQFSIDQARHDWILTMDADERVTDELRGEIEGLRSRGFPGTSYEVPRRNIYLGKELRRGLFWPDRKLRLFNRGRAKCGGVDPHDRIETTDGSRPEILRGGLRHTSFHTFEEHLQAVDRYTRVAAEALWAQGRRATVLDLLVRPPAVVFKSLILKRGFVDGWRGFLVSGMAGYYDWLKYWRLIRGPKS